MNEPHIDLSEIPEITEEQIKRATLRVAGKPATWSDSGANIYSRRVSEEERQGHSTIGTE